MWIVCRQRVCVKTGVFEELNKQLPTAWTMSQPWQTRHVCLPSTCPNLLDKTGRDETCPPRRTLHIIDVFCLSPLLFFVLTILFPLDHFCSSRPFDPQRNKHILIRFYDVYPYWRFYQWLTISFWSWALVNIQTNQSQKEFFHEICWRQEFIRLFRDSFSSQQILRVSKQITIYISFWSNNLLDMCDLFERR